FTISLGFPRWGAARQVSEDCLSGIAKIEDLARRQPIFAVVGSVWRHTQSFGDKLSHHLQLCLFQYHEGADFVNEAPGPFHPGDHQASHTVVTPRGKMAADSVARQRRAHNLQKPGLLLGDCDLRSEDVASSAAARLDEADGTFA